MYLMTAKIKHGAQSSADLVPQLCMENVKNDTLKGWYFLNNYLVRSKTFDQAYREKVEKYKPYILSDVQKQKLYAFELTIRTFAEGEQAINFDGKTTDGKTVSLKDMKGKVVLVDVWATWCGPCRGEIPSLKKLEAAMEGKDVVFISYSIDEQKDLEKWKKMIVTDTLGGLQLIGDAAWKSAICTNYKITGIPRFMVFDKDGKIVTTDSPRPSTPELKALLEKQLQ
jgi:thiol-disulfide isomerase/thioredoxin